MALFPREDEPVDTADLTQEEAVAEARTDRPAPTVP
jgi:hypothetical protein